MDQLFARLYVSGEGRKLAMSDRNEPPPTAGQFADQLTAGIVPMRDVFALAKRCIDMDLDQIEELYQLYLRRHDRIDDWSLVDRAAPSVVGDYLADKPRDPLYRLALSESAWERRTAIVATWAFIRRGELDDTFAIAELLVDDPEHLVQTAPSSTSTPTNDATTAP